MEIHLDNYCRNILPSFPVFAVLPIAAIRLRPLKQKRH